MNAPRAAVLAAAMAAGLAPGRARAIAIPLDQNGFPHPAALISTDLANSAARAMGLVTDHRALEPATTLPPPIGLDISIQAGLVRVPQEFLDRLEALGMDTSALNTALPVPKVIVHKSLGTRAE